MYGLFSDDGRLLLPDEIFAQAVSMAQLERAGFAAKYTAVDHLVWWWNHTAPWGVRMAETFMYYVRRPPAEIGGPIVWDSGDVQEGPVSEQLMAESTSVAAEAEMAGGAVRLVFYARPETHTRVGADGWFAAKKVDGTEGASGGLPADLTGAQVLASDAYDALHTFQARFGHYGLIAPAPDRR